jgi:hypothetical protein
MRQMEVRKGSYENQPFPSPQAEGIGPKRKGHIQYTLAAIRFGDLHVLEEVVELQNISSMFVPRR